MCRVTVSVVFAITSLSSNGARHTIHYDTAHSTAHVDDTLGGSPLSGKSTRLATHSDVQPYRHHNKREHKDSHVYYTYRAH